MAWLIQLNDDYLETEAVIESLSPEQIMQLKLILVEPHFNKREIGGLINRCESDFSLTEPVCKRIREAFASGIFDFDLLLQISGWLKTDRYKKRNPRDCVLDIIRKMFYGETFERFSAPGNTEPDAKDIKGIFRPWLIRVMHHTKR